MKTIEWNMKKYLLLSLILTTFSCAHSVTKSVDFEKNEQFSGKIDTLYDAQTLVFALSTAVNEARTSFSLRPLTHEPKLFGVAQNIASEYGKQVFKCLDPQPYTSRAIVPYAENSNVVINFRQESVFWTTMLNNSFREIPFIVKIIP